MLRIGTSPGPLLIIAYEGHGSGASGSGHAWQLSALWREEPPTKRLPCR